MANKTNSLAHTKWMCKYHIVFIPKYRRKAIVITIIFVIIYCLFLLTDNKTYAICIAEGIILTASLQALCLVEKIKLVSKKEDNATMNEAELN